MRIYSEERRGYTVVVFGSLAVPIGWLISLALAPLAVSMVAGFIWDTVFGAAGAGVVLFLSVSTVYMVIGGLVGLGYGIIRGVRVFREVNGYGGRR